MKVTIKTISPLISSSGESSAHIDADVKYDRYGFPYIQGKTIKGLLRESAMEVCDMEGNEYGVVNKLFGLRGQMDSGELKFNNFHIGDYETIVNELRSSASTLPFKFIQNHYTLFRKQTSIEDGVAVPTSLRNYRLIKEDIIFESAIENIPDNIEEENLIKKAILNLRYMGTRRNRGFGKVKIGCEEEEPSKNISSVAGIQLMQEKIDDKKLSFTVTTESSIVFSKIVGEQNTVSTEHFIPAQNIRGLIAGLIAKEDTSNNSLHKKGSTFEKIILSGTVKYNHAFLKGCSPTPRAYGYVKTITGSPAENLFNSSGKVLKGMSGFSTINDNEIKRTEVESSFSFHTSRINDRQAGRSTEGKGAIFYYEGIDEGQQFAGEIIGPGNYLEYIKELLKQNGGRHRMGRSKSAQYAKVKFEDFDIKEFKTSETTPNPFYLVFQTPVITHNKSGMAVPDVTIIEAELQELSHDLKITNIASAPELVETYMGVWKSKTPREAAFDIGTTIEVSGTITKEQLKSLVIDGIGERKNEGFGRVKLVSIESSLSRIEPEKKMQSENYDFSFTNENLNKINNDFKKAKDELNIQLKALEKQKPGSDKLKNSLIGRLKEGLIKSNTSEKWVAFMEKLMGKKAHKTLNEVGLWEELKQINNKPESNSFELNKIFWLTYFKSARRKNKKHENKREQSQANG